MRKAIKEAASRKNNTIRLLDGVRGALRDNPKENYIHRVVRSDDHDLSIPEVKEFDIVTKWTNELLQIYFCRKGTAAPSQMPEITPSMPRK